MLSKVAHEVRTEDPPNVRLGYAGVFRAYLRPAALALLLVGTVTGCRVAFVRAEDPSACKQHRAE